jgi:hypothetical protein
MKTAAVGMLWACLLGCIEHEPNYRAYGMRPHEWSLPGPDYEDKVFGPMPFEEVRDFVRSKESDGWLVIGYELASLPDDLMVNEVELDHPSKPKRAWTFDIPKTPDPSFDPPAKPTIPPYLNPAVKDHRQRYLVVLRRWL